MDQTVQIRRAVPFGESIENTFGSTDRDQPIMHQNDVWSTGLAYHLGIMSDQTVHAANLLKLDYLVEARSLPSRCPIVDVHTHLSGKDAVRCYQEVAEAYGITLTYSMTPLEQVETVQSILGDRVRFIAVPDFAGEDRLHAHGEGFLDRIRSFHKLGSRIVKFWSAPRGADYGIESGHPGLLSLDSPQRLQAMDLASELGMIFMTHVADPDTWFETKYADSDLYGTKRAQYEPLEKLLARYKQPWIAAHMGGWPEDLAFLDGLLERHDNLHLDTSATKWMVRVLSTHSHEQLTAFLRRWKGRILFGSDIVTREEHMAPVDRLPTDPEPQASSPAEAFDLYASRYWALRTLWEGNYEGPSPIADPDLEMVEPERFGPLDSPRLAGKRIPDELLESLYHDAAVTLLAPDRDMARS